MSDANVSDGSTQEEADQGAVQVTLVLQSLRQGHRIRIRIRSVTDSTDPGVLSVLQVHLEVDLSNQVSKLEHLCTSTFDLGAAPQTHDRKSVWDQEPTRSGLTLSSLPGPAEARSPAAPGLRWSPSTGPPSSAAPGLGI